MKNGILIPDETKRHSQFDRILRHFRTTSKDKTQSTDEVGVARELAKVFGLGPGKKIKLVLLRGQEGDGISWTLQSIVDKTQDAVPRGSRYAVVSWPQASGGQTDNSVSAEILAQGFAANNLRRWLFIFRHGTWGQRGLYSVKLVTVVAALYFFGMILSYAVIPNGTLSVGSLLDYFHSLPLSRHLVFFIASLLSLYAGGYLIEFVRMQPRAKGRLMDAHYALLRNHPSVDFAPLRSAYAARVGFSPILNVVDAADRLGEFDRQFVTFLLFKSGESQRTAFVWLIAYTDKDAPLIKLIRKGAEAGSEQHQFDVMHYELLPLSAAERVRACELHHQPVERAQNFTTLHDLVRGRDSAEEEQWKQRWHTFLHDHGVDSPSLLQQPTHDRLLPVDLVKYLALSGAYAAEGFTPAEIAFFLSTSNPVFSAHAQQRNWKPGTYSDVLSILHEAQQTGSGLIEKRGDSIVLAPDARPVIEEEEARRCHDTGFIHHFWAQHYAVRWKENRSLDEFERVYFHLARAQPCFPSIAQQSSHQAIAESLELSESVAAKLLEACRFSHLSQILLRAFGHLRDTTEFTIDKTNGPLVASVIKTASEHFFLTADPSVASAADDFTNQHAELAQSGFSREAELLRGYKDLICGRHSEVLKQKFSLSNTNSIAPGGRLAALQSFLQLECTVRFEFGFFHDFVSANRELPEPDGSATDEILLFHFKLLDRLTVLAIWRGQFNTALKLLGDWAVKCDDLSRKLETYDLLKGALVPLYKARLVHLLLDIRAYISQLQRQRFGSETEQQAIVKETLEIANLLGAPTPANEHEAERNLCRWVLDQYDQAVALAELLDLQLAMIEAQFGRGLCLKDHHDPWFANEPDTWKTWDADFHAVLNLEHRSKICLRSPDVLVVRISALRSVPSLVLADVATLFRLTRDYSFARRAQVGAYRWMFAAVTAAGKGQLLEELIEAANWWIKQIEDDSSILHLLDEREPPEPMREIIDTLIFLSQYSRQLEKFEDARRYLGEAESRMPLLPPAAREDPSLILDLGIQNIWLKKALEEDCRLDVDKLFDQEDIHKETVFGYVLETKLQLSGTPLDHGILDVCLRLLKQYFTTYNIRASVVATVGIAEKARSLAEKDDCLWAEITELLLTAAATWADDRIPETMIDLYGALRDYDKAQAASHQKELNSWVATSLAGEERLRTEALYQKGNYHEAWDHLLHAFRFHVRRLLTNEVRQARDLFSKGHYQGCRDALGRITTASFRPTITNIDGTLYVALDRLEFLRLQRDCYEKLNDSRQAHAFAEKFQTLAKNSIPELLNSLITSGSLDKQLQETIKSYLEIHERFP